MTTTATEAQRRYDTLTKRIEALDTDIGRITDSEQKFGLEQRRAALVAERDTVMSEMIAGQRRGNGDLEMLQQKVADLAKVLAGEHPQEAHQIIMECTGALARLDERVYGLEGRVSAIEHHINPPLSVTLWRIMALVVVLFGGSLFWVKDSRDVLFGLVLWAGVIVEASLVVLAVVCLLMANAKLREYTK